MLLVLLLSRILIIYRFYVGRNMMMMLMMMMMMMIIKTKLLNNKDITSYIFLMSASHKVLDTYLSQIHYRVSGHNILLNSDFCSLGGWLSSLTLVSLEYA